MTENPDDEGKKTSGKEEGKKEEGGSKMTENPDDEGKKMNGKKEEGGSKMTEEMKPDDEGKKMNGKAKEEEGKSADQKPNDEGKKANSKEEAKQEEVQSIQGAAKLIFTARFDQLFTYIGHKLPASQTFLEDSSNLLDRYMAKGSNKFAGQRVISPRVVTGFKQASKRLGSFAGSVAVWLVFSHLKDTVSDLIENQKKKKADQSLKEKLAEDLKKKVVRRAKKAKAMSALVSDVTVLQLEVKELNEWRLGLVKAFSSPTLVNTNTPTSAQIANEEIRKAKNYFSQRRF